MGPSKLVRVLIDGPVAFCCLAVCSVVVGHQSPAQELHPRMDDPVFGISFNPRKVHYEPIPTLIQQKCQGYKQGTFWVFAHLRSERGDYYVVAGTRPGQDGDSLGAVLLIENGACDSADATWTLSGAIPEAGYEEVTSTWKLPGEAAPELCEKGPQFPYGMGPCHYVLRSKSDENILRGLIKDALTRGARAWGSEALFKTAACTSSAQRANSSVATAQELAKFCR